MTVKIVKIEDEDKLRKQFFKDLRNATLNIDKERIEKALKKLNYNETL